MKKNNSLFLFIYVLIFQLNTIFANENFNFEEEVKKIIDKESKDTFDFEKEVKKIVQQESKIKFDFEKEVMKLNEIKLNENIKKTEITLYSWKNGKNYKIINNNWNYTIQKDDWSFTKESFLSYIDAKNYLDKNTQKIIENKKIVIKPKKIISSNNTITKKEIGNSIDISNTKLKPYIDTKTKAS